MHASLSKPGQRVVVTALGETPMDALEQHLALEPMTAPSALKPSEVLVPLALVLTFKVPQLSLRNRSSPTVAAPAEQGRNRPALAADGA